MNKSKRAIPRRHASQVQMCLPSPQRQELRAEMMCMVEMMTRIMVMIMVVTMKRKKKMIDHFDEDDDVGKH